MEKVQAKKRLGVLAVVIEDRSASERLNAILSGAADIIVGRMGMPYKDRGVSVISLILDGTTDEINFVSGKLGQIPGVSVKAALTKE